MNRIRVSHLRKQSGQQQAFTLIELLVVIAIIAVLIGLLFPAFRAVQNQAKQAQAKNDLTQIVNAVNAFYTDYGRYPLPAGTTTDKTFGPGGDPSTNETLFNPLRGVEPVSPTMLNPRQIVFISPPAVKDPANPRSGIATAAGNLGQYFDPWGSNYVIRIDGNYDNQLTTNPYGNNQGAGPSPLSIGVIAWSLGRDQTLGTTNNGIYTNSDDVISWQ